MLLPTLSILHYVCFHELQNSVSNLCFSIVHFKVSSKRFAEHKGLKLIPALNCRSVTMRCCGFDSLSPEFASLNQLEYLHIMDPYHDLRVLCRLPALTWLRVFAYRSCGDDQTLQLELPPSLRFLDVKCNEKRGARGGSVYLRCCLDKVCWCVC